MSSFTFPVALILLILLGYFTAFHPLLLTLFIVFNTSLFFGLLSLQRHFKTAHITQALRANLIFSFLLVAGLASSLIHSLLIFFYVLACFGGAKLINTVRLLKSNGTKI
ncbi:MAG: hypothetical protein H6502_00705 [Candidatus Woesearchaeota archaeon]|nr:MAG: hypothetical protein H6502_00705 [Candidatus Woesearchaeota archaeon]